MATPLAQAEYEKQTSESGFGIRARPPLRGMDQTAKRLGQSLDLSCRYLHLGPSIIELRILTAWYRFAIQKIVESSGGIVLSS